MPACSRIFRAADPWARVNRAAVRQDQGETLLLMAALGTRVEAVEAVEVVVVARAGPVALVALAARVVLAGPVARAARVQLVAAEACRVASCRSQGAAATAAAARARSVARVQRAAWEAFSRAFRWQVLDRRPVSSSRSLEASVLCRGGPAAA